MAQTVKRLLAMQETRVRPLGREDLLEKEMATHSSVLAWRIPWTEEPGGLQTTGLQEWDTSVRFSSVHFSQSVVSDSLRPHEPQHIRPPCPSPTLGVDPNPCPLSR